MTQLLFLSSRFLFPLLANALLILWAWLGFNQGKGIAFFATDVVGLMLTLPLLVFINLLCWTITLCLKREEWAKGFGILGLLSLVTTLMVWIYGFLSGATS
ncbi:hypothetical protein [Hymenobacter cellulosilyticus]|uniref:Uncharacterized protein n=1 Tax=Hymenobacter cellulosilyticus TaxID=2932248 RepID=A0A8T9Q663_9BACT|nr:hypothetical protein [Hymenobacter cellulosilyticus]UOQ71478.1 hypothetical protein MUN79_23115 [Hymenobacter cellulosilyticus]